MDESGAPGAGTPESMDACLKGAYECLMASMACAVLLRDVEAVSKLASAVEAINELRWCR